MSAVYKKEMRLFFVTMPGYVFIFTMLLAIGAVCVAYNFVAGNSHFQNVLSFMSMFMIFAVPILTMRTFSEERKQRTDQLMFTLPLKSYQIVLGKYLALLTILAIPMLIMCIYPLILSNYGTIDLRTSYCAILAMYFLGCALCSIGMFLSSITENQLISAIISFGLLFFCYEAGRISTVFSPGAMNSYRAFLLLSFVLALFILYVTRNAMVALVAEVIFIIPLLIVYKLDFTLLAGTFPLVIAQLALFDRMSIFIHGIFDITSLVYYLSVSAIFLFFTVKVMEMRRWR